MAGTFYVCLLKKFNNYFNRTIKGYDTFLEYENAIGAENFYLYDKTINFSFADNVSTELVMNGCPFSADYLLLLDTSYNIVSRWFILDDVYTREGQRKLSLRRDLIFDYKTSLVSSPAYIQKAMLADNDPFIFNSEGMNYNQIKTSETLLKDKTNTAWIVGYIAKDAAPQDITVSLPVETVAGAVSLGTIASAMGISEGTLASLLNFDGGNNNEARFTNSVELRWGYTETFDYYKPHRYRQIFASDFSALQSYSNENVLNWQHPLWNGRGEVFSSNLTPSIIAHKNSILASMSTITNRTYLTSNQLAILRNYLNKTILYNNKYYKLSLNIAGEESDPRIGYSVYSTWPAIAAAVDEAANNTPSSAGSFRNTGEMAIFTKSTVVYIQMSLLNLSALSVVISSSRRTILDQAYDMFVIPYSSARIVRSGTFVLDTDRDSAKMVALACEIAKNLDAKLYDLQLLPYCPLEEMDINGSIDLDLLTNHVGYEIIKDTDDYPMSILFWCKKASFTRQLEYSLNLKNSVKVESECNKYRIVSPNYQGCFDFNVAKNGGSVPYFIADCTYKPYTPYLKIAPAFSYMYGTNFGDCRGLICGGDFSLPRFTSAWETYQLNNKNYQNIFNREIQNLDFEQSMQFRQQAISGGIGIAAAGIGGAAVGAKVGGVYGAAAGALIGTAGSAVGYAIDLDMLGQRQKEAKDYAIDKFNYQLGNIKALPYTITKVGSFDINSKIWPFLEYYTCTEEEKIALENKIQYESMTVMRVDILENYFSSTGELHYLKCELIRNEEIAEDNHVYQAIYNELAKGVYI